MNAGYTVTLDCDCGGVMSHEAYVIGTRPDLGVEVSLELFGDFEIVCNTCARKLYIPPVLDFVEEWS